MSFELCFLVTGERPSDFLPVVLSCQCSVVWKLQTQTPAVKYKRNVSTDLSQWGPNVLDQLCSHCNLCLLYCPTNWTKNNKTEKILSLSEDTINRADFDFSLIMLGMFCLWCESLFVLGSTQCLWCITTSHSAVLRCCHWELSMSSSSARYRGWC